MSEKDKQRWPNNKPTLTTEEELFKRGMAVECREPETLQGYTPVWCVNIFGVHEYHMLESPHP